MRDGWLLGLSALVLAGMVWGCAGDGGEREPDPWPQGGHPGSGMSGAGGSSGAGGQGGAGGTAGNAGGSGGAGSGGAGGNGGAGGFVREPVVDAGADQCVHEGEPVLDPAMLTSCESDTCQNAHCLPMMVLTPEQAEKLADCEEPGNKCVPDLFIVTLGEFLLPSCESIGGAEGRCLSTCVPQVAAQLDMLPQATCAEGERCAPCFDPFTGEETGACGQSCDPGPVDPPYVFAECCGELGVCVPDALVPEEQRAMLGEGGCAEAGLLCAPRAFAQDRSATPASCTSLLGAEGRCLPSCLPSVATQAGVLPQDSCAAGELCAPCFDPFTGAATGACEINDDAPEQGPVVFAECCGGRSSCVPESLVPDEQRSLLDGQGCGSDELCAPKDVARGDYAPQSCTSWGGAEGRCLIDCLPDVAAQADRLSRGACDEGELCVPCYDPLTGESTGACAISGDAPVEDPPYVFPTCCDDGTGNDLGTCVPGELVPAEQQSLLGADTCSGEGFLCAPSDLARDEYEPESCTSWGGAEGRCLMACLPDVAAQADRLSRGTCDQGELCVPCYDPLTGENTSACTLDGDAPADPPYVFPTCCDDGMGNDLGTCVPAELVPEAQRSLLSADTCSTEGFLCAPNARVADPDYEFPSCTTTCGADFVTCGIAAFGGAFGQPGACVPSCLLTTQETPVGGNAANLYGQSTCGTGEDCAPCVNPTTDEETGVCE